MTAPRNPVHFRLLLRHQLLTGPIALPLFCRPYIVLLATVQSLQLLRVYGQRLIGIDTKFDLNLARLPTLVGCLSDYGYKGRLAFAGIISDEQAETIRACLEVGIVTRICS